MDIGVGRHGASHVDADGRGVDELGPRDPLGVHGPHVGGERCAGGRGVDRGNEALQHERGLARARDARHGHELTARNVNGKRLHGVDGVRLQVDATVLERFGDAAALNPSGPLPHHAPRPGEKRPDTAFRRAFHIRNRALCDHVPAAGAGNRSHLDEPVRLGEDALVVVDHHHGVAIGEEVAHDAHEAVDVRGMEADRGFVQHVEHAGGAVAHGARELHALALAGGEGGTCAVEREVAEP